MKSDVLRHTIIKRKGACISRLHGNTSIKVYFNRFILFSGYIEQSYKSIQKIKAQCMGAFGLRSTDAMCIVVLSMHEEGLTATELAAQCKVDKAVISRSVKTLLEVGAIKYAGEKRNYRSRLTLTSHGKEIAQSMSDMAKDAVLAVSDGVEPDQLREFYKAFGIMNHNLKDYAKGIEI